MGSTHGLKCTIANYRERRFVNVGYHSPAATTWDYSTWTAEYVSGGLEPIVMYRGSADQGREMF